jgi:two-component system KDP operon response regulator KdpE
MCISRGMVVSSCSPNYKTAMKRCHMIQKKSTILIVEDDPSICKVLAITLENMHYNIVIARNGNDGITYAASARPDLILLDLRLPDMDGRQVIAEIREWSNIPIIVCSCICRDRDIVDVLEAGADDYITKPFNSEVLIARVQANLRKCSYPDTTEPEITNGIIRMNLVSHEVYINGLKCVFTSKEYELLHYFMINRGKMLTHQNILKKVWGNAHQDDMQYVRVYVRQLRTKIEPNPTVPRYIITEPGVGYRMENIDTVNTINILAAA